METTSRTEYLEKTISKIVAILLVVTLCIFIGIAFVALGWTSIFSGDWFGLVTLPIQLIALIIVFAFPAVYLWKNASATNIVLIGFFFVSLFVAATTLDHFGSSCVQDVKRSFNSRFRPH